MTDTSTEAVSPAPRLRTETARANGVRRAIRVRRGAGTCGTRAVGGMGGMDGERARDTHLDALREVAALVRGPLQEG